MSSAGPGGGRRRRVVGPIGHLPGDKAVGYGTIDYVLGLSPSAGFEILDHASRAGFPP